MICISTKASLYCSYADAPPNATNTTSHLVLWHGVTTSQAQCQNKCGALTACTKAMFYSDTSRTSSEKIARMRGRTVPALRGATSNCGGTSSTASRSRRRSPADSPSCGTASAAALALTFFITSSLANLPSSCKIGNFCKTLC